MKISSMNNSGAGEKMVITGGKANSINGQVVEFEKTLGQITLKNYQENLQHLISEVDRCAQKLAKSCTLNELKDYKRAVKNFLKETKAKAYETQNETGWDRMGRQKNYILIRKVDQSLEELSEEVLKKHCDELKILEKLDEIRGILVDLYL